MAPLRWLRLWSMASLHWGDRDTMAATDPAATQSSAVSFTAPPVQADFGPRAPWIGVALYAFAASVFLAAMGFESFVNNRFPLRATALVIQQETPATHWGNVANASDSLAWRSAAILLIGTCIAAAAASTLCLWRAWREHRTQTAAILVLALVVAVAAWRIHAAGPTSYLFELATAISAGSPELARRNWSSLLLAPRRYAELVAGAVGLAMAAALILPRLVTPAILAEHTRRLRLVLYVSAAMLIVGVVLTRASYTWAAGFTLDPKSLGDLIDHGTQLTAAFYTLVLAAGFVPAAIILSHAGRRLAADGVSRGEAATADDWLADRKLKDTIRSQLTLIVAVVSPLLSAVAPQLASLAGTR